MAEFHPFERKLTEAWAPSLWRDVTSIVAVSGGADSVALLRALHAVRGFGSGRLIAAHFHHGLRGRESDDDAQFVVQLCNDLGLECQVGYADRSGRKDGESPALSSEQAARDARYAFLHDVTGQSGARYVATAHTADDQAETVLHRVIRGTGIAGLAGIRPYRQFLPGVSLVRPLLTHRRSEITHYLGSIGQPFRTDSSNGDLGFTRNRLRLELLPQLTEAYNSGVVTALNRLSTLAGEAQEVIDQAVDDLFDAAITAQSPAAVTIACVPLRASHRYLVRELLIAVWRRQGWSLREMGFERWEELAQLAISPPAAAPKKVFPGGITAERTGDTLALLAAEAATARSLY